MSRKKREWYPGAIYHVMVRGVRKREIYMQKEDYRVFLAFLEEAKLRYKCKVYAYCLMTNHYHLLIQTDDEHEIWKVMKWLHLKYVKYYNKKYNYVGHIFEARYHSITVETEAYFMQVGRYIHLNPFNAGMVELPEQYPWSSYRAIVEERPDRIITRELPLAGYRPLSGPEYRQFIAAGMSRTDAMRRQEKQIANDIQEYDGGYN